MISVVSRSGVSRCDWTSTGIAIWIATTVTNVRAIAATVRRTTMPQATPMASARRVMPSGNRPRAPKRSGQIRGMLSGPLSVRPRATASSSGWLHQVMASPISAAAAAAEAGDGELGGEPAGPGDALVPDQPVGPGLELAGDQRRAPEHADDGGDGVPERDADGEERRLGVLEREPVEEVVTRRR